MSTQAETDNTAGGIACQDAATLFCEGRDRELSAAEQQSLQLHIAGCAACTAASRQLQAVFNQLRQVVNGEAG